MSILASLVFALAAVATMVALRLTITQYGGVALANVAALRSANTAREFRFQVARVVARPASGEVRRLAVRVTAPRQIKPSVGLRAAA